jgi:hypothetical protein
VVSISSLCGGHGCGSVRHHARVVELDELKAKYAQERAKRLRADGNAQYRRLEGTLQQYLDDPHTPLVEREPLTDHVTVAFIGAGFAGLLTGARLVEAGIDAEREVRARTGDP